MPNKLVTKIKENKDVIIRKSLIYGGSLLGLFVLGSAPTQFNSHAGGDIGELEVVDDPTDTDSTSED